jgi:hypothetical protein
MIHHPEIEQHFLGPLLAWVRHLRGNVYGVVQKADGMHVLCHGLRLLQRQLLARRTPALISTNMYPIIPQNSKQGEPDCLEGGLRTNPRRSKTYAMFFVAKMERDKNKSLYKDASIIYKRF